MSRGINASAGPTPTIAGGATLVTLHLSFGVLSCHTDRFGDLVKGPPFLLVEGVRALEGPMQGSSLSRKDLEEALRLSGEFAEPAQLQSACLARNASIGVLPRDPTPRIVEAAVVEGIHTVRIELR